MYTTFRSNEIHFLISNTKVILDCHVFFTRDKYYYCLVYFVGREGSLHPPDVPVPPNPDPDREIRFFRKSGFFVFSTF